MAEGVEHAFIGDHAVGARDEVAGIGEIDGHNGPPLTLFVMPDLVSGIHVFLNFGKLMTWMAGTSPAMT
jgi:hypothetical protein